MKRSVIFLSIACLVFGLNACQSKSDWAGTYSGVVPCADCSGIETKITLNTNNTYQISWKYQDKGDEVFQRSGTLQWNNDKSIITFGSLDKDLFPNMYKLGKGSLTQLDLNGNVITGNLAPNYVLTKVQ